MNEPGRHCRQELLKSEGPPRGRSAGWQLQFPHHSCMPPSKTTNSSNGFGFRMV